AAEPRGDAAMPQHRREITHGEKGLVVGAVRCDPGGSRRRLPGFLRARGLRLTCGLTSSHPRALIADLVSTVDGARVAMRTINADSRLNCLDVLARAAHSWSGKEDVE